MYNVRFSEFAASELETFIWFYKNLFFTLYSDTWISDEQAILDNYLNLSNNLYFDIRNEAEKILSAWNVLGRIQKSINKYSISYKVGNFLIILVYTENSKLSEREIKSIKFYKK